MEKKRLTKPVGDRLFIKENITSPWEPANLADLKSILSDELIPYSSEGKLKIPQFGFGRKIGETLNEQIYPTRYIVIDLDTPPENKKDLSTNSGFEEWSNFFITGYNKIVEYDSIPYWIMYLTPSMCGLRFIVKLKNNVANENEYIQALKDFLITLKNYEIGEKYIDVRVNHSWFLPTYLKYYNERFARFNNPIVPESPKKEKESSRIEHNDLTKRELDNVVAQIEEKELDITTSYEDWLKIGFALTDFLGEEGREYYHRISKFYNGYDSQECNNQYNNCLRSQGKGITIGSLFWLAQKNGINLRNPNLIYSDSDILCFWKYDSKKKGLKIDIAQFYDYLENEGFAKYYIDPSNAGDIPIFVERDGFQIKQVNKERIIEHSAEFIRRLNVEDEIKSNIRNAFYLGSAKFSENNLATLSITKHPFIEDTKDKAYLFYNDIYLVITKDRVTKHKYEELDKCIWESDKINRDFKTRDFTDVSDSCDFYKFLEDICNIGELGEAKQRLTSIMSIIGYLLNSYKDPTNAKAIILMDSNTSANPQGGTGKSLLIEGLRKIRTSLVIEDGKRLNTKGRFEWVQIKRNTKIVAIDDIRERFNLQDLFSMITNDLIIELKGIDKFSFPFKRSPKFILSTNYAIGGSGESYERRVVEFELSDHYNQNNTPRTKYGREFFTDWDKDQWELFDSLMVYCIQLFLKKGIIKPQSINIKYRKALQATNEEFMDYFRSNIEMDKEHDLRYQYLKFIRQHKEYENVKQNTFTRWINEYASYFGLRLLKRKSGSSRYFTISKDISGDL